MSTNQTGNWMDRIFKNKDVLRASYIPGEFPHRKREIESLASMLVPALRGGLTPNILIYGEPGTGKTAIVKYVGKQMEIMSKRLNVECSMYYLNCERIDTQTRILTSVLKRMGKNVPRIPVDEIYEEFRRSIDSKDQSIVLVFDAIEFLVKRGCEVLYHLLTINSELDRARVSIVAISTDFKFKDFLDSEVAKILKGEEIIFSPYSAEQLQDILRKRAELAFNEEVPEEVISFCSNFGDGDARKALNLLRVSGEIAGDLDSEIITTDHVKKAVEKIEEDYFLGAVRMLSTQTKVLLYGMVLLLEAGVKDFTAGEVYTAYESVCNKVNIDSLSLAEIIDHIAELNMLGICKKQGSFWELNLSLPVERLKKTLFEDFTLQALSSNELSVISEEYVKSFFDLK